MAKAITLPVRLAYKTGVRGVGGSPVFVPAGSTGSHGDAGWTVYTFESVQARDDFMARNGVARMPAWARIEDAYIPPVLRCTP